MIMNVAKLLFNVDSDRKVQLCFGPISVDVCDAPEDFEDFKQALITKLNTIEDELQEYFE